MKPSEITVSIHLGNNGVIKRFGSFSALTFTDDPYGVPDGSDFAVFAKFCSDARIMDQLRSDTNP